MRIQHISRPPLEQRYIDETIASIRLRTRYNDPYEEWEKQTRKDALKTARKELADTQAHLHELQDRKHVAEQKRLELIHTKQLAEIQSVLDRAKEVQQKEETKLKQTWKLRDQLLWERIEAGIRVDEERAAEKKRKLEEEKQRKEREAEEKKRAEEEKRRLEEEKQRKEKEAKERERAEEEKRRLEDETQRKEMEAEEKNPAYDDWRVARQNLLSLKQPVRHVKANKELKSAWGILRRQIVPKIGQLTNDPQAISHISNQIIEIIKPPHDSSIYIAACYSLAKSILLQAETEVTAEKRSAIPLAQVTFTLLETLEHFPSIFFSKLVQRCGGWPIPLFIGNHDHDKRPWADQAEYSKVVGYRKSAQGEGLETTEEYSNRVSGIMRVYFHILKIRPVQKPLYSMFQLPRYWTWFARILNDRRLLAQPIAAQLIYTALDVLGLEAKSVWGQQWDKMLHLIETGVTTGYEDNKLIGGDCAEGSAARTRVMLVLENL